MRLLPTPAAPQITIPDEPLSDRAASISRISVKRPVNGHANRTKYMVGALVAAAQRNDNPVARCWIGAGTRGGEHPRVDAMPTDGLFPWLLDSDPALRWQVERDLIGAPPEGWRATRAAIATEGWGARLLALQDADGQWAGGAFFPADFDFQGSEVGQPWTATTWSLNSLREWGMDPAVLRERRTAQLLEQHSRWEYENLPYWDGEVDCCINAWTVANGLWLGADVTSIVEWFVEHRLPDGGWNCDWVDGSTRSSFHSTLNALKGLLAFDTATGGTADTRAARHSGEEYLLRRGLFRRLSTGDPVAPWVDRFFYPFRWGYNVLNAAEYYRQAALFDGTQPDPRMADAIDLIRAARQHDCTWLQAGRHPGPVWFEVDVPAGEPSKWLTLFGTRVLAWWDSAR
jgi:hypothetical protein